MSKIRALSTVYSFLYNRTPDHYDLVKLYLKLTDMRGKQCIVYRATSYYRIMNQLENMLLRGNI